METNDTITPEATPLNQAPTSNPGDDQPRRGRRRRWGLFVVALAVFAVVFGRPGAAPAGWGGDFEVALEQAKSGRRHVVVAFHGDYCPPCLAMDRFVLGKQAIRDALVDFVPVRIDPKDHNELARKYEIYATPTYVVINSDGALIHKIVGPQDVEEFVSFLQTSLGMAAIAQSSGV